MIETCKMEIKGRQYEVAFPNVGQFCRIEALKQDLSMGKYNEMLSSKTSSSLAALDMIDIEATLTILCPALIQDLKVRIGELGVVDYVEIKKEYVKTVVPFLKKINDILYDVTK